MIRTVTVLVVAAAFSLTGALGLIRTEEDTRQPPGAVTGAGDPTSYAALSGGDLTEVVTALQDRLANLPEDDSAWASLALAYVEQARVTGDASYYAKAEQAVASSLEVRPEENAPALAAAAALAGARHEFTEALRRSDEALATDPYQPTAHATRVDALTELGRYDDQLAALRKADRRQPGTPVATRFAYAQEIRGDLDGAAQVLQRTADSANDADRAFALTILADVDRRRGRLEAADRHLQIVRRLDPAYLPAMVSAARLWTARGELAEATRQWQQVVERIPLTEYLTELGELQLHLGRPDAAADTFAVVDATHTLMARSGVNVDLESALFEADHGDPALALDSARTEWESRKSLHVADAYAWALHRNDRDHEALPIAREATRLGTPEARLWIHRGLIEQALGLDQAAARHLRRGLDTDPGLSPWQATRARSALRTLQGSS